MIIEKVILGSFTNKYAKAYNKSALELHGEFASLNIIPSVELYKNDDDIILNHKREKLIEKEKSKEKSLKLVNMSKNDVESLLDKLDCARYREKKIL